ncbi:hypothetical protein QE152_g34884 [Popillia japonica]|uniref:Uncharacterized protein n=1 Tax=Popillia japonica TaxID=7064 RepID=A0AAW1IT51_POPJA
MENYWKQEEIIPVNESVKQTTNECEEHFLKTHTRDSNGRYNVSLPFKDNQSKLGNSLEIATQRFKNLERKLQRDNSLKSSYADFLREYEALGHMTNIIPPDNDSNAQYYLPHREYEALGHMTNIIPPDNDSNAQYYLPHQFLLTTIRTLSITYRIIVF